jgi:hypothetical protein
VFAITYERGGRVTVHCAECAKLLSDRFDRPPCRTARSIGEARTFAAGLVWPPTREPDLCEQCRPEAVEDLVPS